MPSDNPFERELFRAALQRSNDCPPAEALEHALDGSDPRTAAHAQSCPFCSAELQMLRSFRLAEVPPEDAGAVKEITRRLDAGIRLAPVRAVEPRRPWWLLGGSWLRPAALALAGMLVLIGIGLQLRHAGPPALGSVGEGSQVFRSGALTILSPSGDLQKAPGEAKWDAVASAATYRVSVLEVDGNELWNAQTADTRLAFPPDLRARIVPAKTLLIEVTAFDTTGRKVAESERVRFRILQNLYPR